MLLIPICLVTYWISGSSSFATPQRVIKVESTQLHFRDTYVVTMVDGSTAYANSEIKLNDSVIVKGNYAVLALTSGIVANVVTNNTIPAQPTRLYTLRGVNATGDVIEASVEQDCKVEEYALNKTMSFDPGLSRQQLN